MSDGHQEVSVLFVCMGNICRSPTAHGVFRQKVEEAGLQDRVFIDSAGTHAYHIGEPPDSRSQSTARQRGYELSDLRARKITASDFSHFDYFLVMDHDNLTNSLDICPPGDRNKVRLFLQYALDFEEQEVPDPYYGGAQGFSHVLDLVESASEGLLKEIRQRYSL